MRTTEQGASHVTGAAPPSPQICLWWWIYQLSQILARLNEGLFYIHLLVVIAKAGIFPDRNTAKLCSVDEDDPELPPPECLCPVLGGAGVEPWTSCT